MKAKQCTLDSSMSKYGQIHVRIRPGTITMSLDQCRNEAKHSTLPWCLHQDKARYQKHETESLLGQGHFYVRIMQDTIKMRLLPCQDTGMCVQITVQRSGTLESSGSTLAQSWFTPSHRFVDPIRDNEVHLSYVTHLCMRCSPNGMPHQILLTLAHFLSVCGD